MFTGIVERTAKVSRILDRAGSRVLELKVEDSPRLAPLAPVTLGESIAVSGVCLTVVSVEPMSFDVVPETLSKTTLSGLRQGDRVNLERSLRVGDSFGGHYVTGHVDGVGHVKSRQQVGDQALFEIAAPPHLTRQMIPKGSIAVDGISLTLIDVERREGWFSFAAIPHTLERTTLSLRQPGSAVNLETDAFGKWVLHGLECLKVDARSQEPLTELLGRAGFKLP